MKWKIREMNQKFDAKTTARETDASSGILSMIAKKTMERKEKLKLMYSCQNGITDKSFSKLSGFNNNVLEIA